MARAGAQDAFVLMRGEAVPRVVAGGELATLVGASPVVAPSELASAFGARRRHLTAARRGGGRADGRPGAWPRSRAGTTSSGSSRGTCARRAAPVPRSGEVA